MNRRNLFAATCCAAVGAALVVGSIATAADPAKDAKPAAAAPAGQPEMKLPPGWTADDMQACIAAGMPGKMHQHLAKTVGTWQGKNTMWMAPGAEPVKSDSTTKVTAIMDGRFTRSEMSGEMPGMGPYTGMAITGFDNVSGKFVGTWVDNHSTGIMTGVGELAADGKTTTWSYTYNCPLNKKPAVMRQVETLAGPGEMKLEMFANDPKTGKEYKMMVIEMTRK